jgi:hypothetical protein
MNVEIMQWDLKLSDVVKFKSIISLAQLHGQLNPPPALPFIVRKKLKWNSALVVNLTTTTEPLPVTSLPEANIANPN